MTKIVIDTCTYSDALRGLPYAVEALNGATQVIITRIVVAELLAGFQRGNQSQKNTKQLHEFLARPSVLLVSITLQTSEFFAHILNLLHKAGQPIPTNDIWIAACALEHGARVISNDKHFKKIPGLIV